MIPITVVTGFLGSGKTSLIAHLLDNTPDRSIAVIVNDMAARSVDAAFLRGGEHIAMESDEMVRTITGGRVGAGKLELLLEEIRALASREHPPEAILLETSGGSPALALAEALRQEEDLAERVRLDTIIAVADGGALSLWWKDRLLRPVLTDQIAAADLVVLNKLDRSTVFSRLGARRILKSIRRDITWVSTEFGRVDPELLINTGRRKNHPAPSRAHLSNPNHYPLVARQLEELRPFHPERLDQWLNQEWPGIVRIKGFAWIATDMDHVYVIDAAGLQREIGLEGTWYGALPPGEVPQNDLIQEALKRGPHQDRQQSITVIGVPEAVEREMRNLRNALLSGTEMDRGARGWASLPDPIMPQFSSDQTSGQAPDQGPASPEDALKPLSEEIPQEALSPTP
ncbi:GTPase, G3E family [Alkalispirochaeta americana]|uniref:GTPase, G3E family n=1 Tax=Alkalispirochaeta americana TaxID=159291 RepID=A0A1N6R9M2_9SPIO|nr:GTP-binding protein [Alkalispirochaeta americana]SIQ25534.1 GTPase, G3E family [Alkalispirochaeta americana]